MSVPAASVSGQKYWQISLGSFIFPLVTVTQQIPVEQLSGLGLHEGDTLHVLSRLDSAFLVQIVHLREIAPPLDPTQQSGFARGVEVFI